MSFTESVVSGVRRLSEEIAPGVAGALGERVSKLRTRFDELNRSLASKALPECRRERVKNLVLEQKAAVASQRRRAMRVVRSSRSS